MNNKQPRKISRTFLIEPTHIELAQCFVALDTDEKAAFFNQIYRIWESRTMGAIPQAMIAVSESEVINEKGSLVMKLIGDIKHEW